jgi:hypothetical protein
MLKKAITLPHGRGSVPNLRNLPSRDREGALFGPFEHPQDLSALLGVFFSVSLCLCGELASSKVTLAA